MSKFEAHDTCKCELQHRQWNGAGKCLNCGERYYDSRDPLTHPQSDSPTPTDAPKIDASEIGRLRPEVFAAEWLAEHPMPMGAWWVPMLRDYALSPKSTPPAPTTEGVQSDIWSNEYVALLHKHLDELRGFRRRDAQHAAAREAMPTVDELLADGCRDPHTLEAAAPRLVHELYGEANNEITRLRSDLAARDATIERMRTVEAGVRAEALTKAADAWTQGGWADAPRRADRATERLATAQYVGDWLRARAAADPQAEAKADKSPSEQQS